jgi:hypothetical protein
MGNPGGDLADRIDCDGRAALRKYSIYTVADYVDTREDQLLANGIDI